MTVSVEPPRTHPDALDMMEGIFREAVSVITAMAGIRIPMTVGIWEQAFAVARRVAGDTYTDNCRKRNLEA